MKEISFDSVLDIPNLLIHLPEFRASNNKFFLHLRETDDTQWGKFLVLG